MKTATSCTLPPIVASEQPKSVSRAHASDGGTRPRAVATHSLLESSPGPPSRLAPLSTRQGRLDTLMTSLETLSCVAGESTARKLKLATEANAVQPGTSSAAAAKHTPLIFAALMGQVWGAKALWFSSCCLFFEIGLYFVVSGGECAGVDWTRCGSGHARLIRMDRTSPWM